MRRQSVSSWHAARAVDAKIELTSGGHADPHAGRSSGDSVRVLTAGELRSLLSPGSALSALGRYRSVELAVDDVRALLSIKPKLAARWLSRGICYVTDRSGRRHYIQWGDLVAGALHAARAVWAWKGVRRRIVSDLERLAEQRLPASPGSGPPLYLRCDLWRGLEAGGSLGHIGGILKGLADVGLPPVFASIERLSTVPARLPMIELDSGPPCWLHPEQTQLAFNAAVVERVESVWQHPPPRFVYQRHALNTYAGLQLARRFGVPLVLEYNGPEVWVAEHWGRGLYERELARQCEQTVLRGAHLIATVSDVLSESLRAQGLDARRIISLPNAVDLDVFRPDREVSALRASLGLDGFTTIGFIGTFGPWHGVEVLIEAYAQLHRAVPDLARSTRLVLVGDGARMAAARALVDAFGLAGSVVLTGLVPQARGPDHVALFDIAAAPTVPNPDGSPFFGSPTKMFEYMAAGRAIVASSLGQVAQIIRDGETGVLVPGGDAAALSGALARLAGDSSLRARLGAAARLEAERHHGYGARADMLLDALERRRYI
jgi:glycosyltransferase involved in cell wall biosynthesis